MPSCAIERGGLTFDPGELKIMVQKTGRMAVTQSVPTLPTSWLHGLGVALPEVHLGHPALRSVTMRERIAAMSVDN
jgi:hypothetical protein